MSTFIRNIANKKTVLFSICLFVGFLVLFSCRKDPKPNFDCEEIPPFTESNYGFGYKYISDTIKDISYGLPQFNPNNSDEIIFYRSDKKNSTNSMVKYNLNSKLETIVYEGDIASHPRWSIKDWIIFGKANGNVWKIRSSGDSLTQLTFDNQSYSPIWNQGGNKFIARNISSNLMSVIYSENGIPLDTISFDVYNSDSWDYDSLLISHHYFKIDVINPNNNQLLKSYEYDANEVLWGSVLRLDAEFIVWSQIDGIYKSDINFSKIEKVKSTCNAEQYLLGSVNNTKNKMIWFKVSRTLMNEDTIYQTNTIVLMNTDGSGEVTILGEK
ncbi:MAG: hypothetical protein WDZ35_04670 [Crocinitomicaceae bacterium]